MRRIAAAKRQTADLERDSQATNATWTAQIAEDATSRRGYAIASTGFTAPTARASLLSSHKRHKTVTYIRPVERKDLPRVIRFHRGFFLSFSLSLSQSCDDTRKERKKKKTEHFLRRKVHWEAPAFLCISCLCFFSSINFSSRSVCLCSLVRSFAYVLSTKRAAAYFSNGVC